MTANTPSKLSRRSFLRIAGAAGASAAALSVLPAPRTVARAAAGGTVKWAEFYSLLTDASGKLNQEWIAKVVQQFEDENPGWKVEREAIKWDQIDQKSIIDLSAGVDHDLMFSSPQLMAKHAKTADYIDLTSYLKTLDKSELDDLNWSPGYKSATIGTQQIGLATGLHTRTNVYNRDMFKTAGLDPDKPFTTLDEVVETGKKLTKADQDVWGLGLYLGPSRATIELYYAPIVWAYGGDFYDAAAKKATLTGDASLKAVKWLYDCVKTWKITPPYAYDPTATYDDLIFTAFTKGKIAQGMGYGSYWIGGVQQAGMYEGCFPATKDCKPGKAGVMVQPGAARAQFTNAWCLSIHKLSKVPDMAFKLLMTIMKPENLKTYPDAGLPGRLSAWAAPEYSSQFYQTWLDAAKSGRSMPPTPYYAELSDAVAAAIQEVLSKDADIAATMKKTEDEWNAQYAGQ